MRYAALLLFARLLIGAENPPLPVVPEVDLQRYAGTWYEIARLPNRFERDCARDVTATYTLRPDGKINVVNQCRKADGEMKTARGTAKLADKNGPKSKLKVTFFWPFYGNYWIVGLDRDYRWALVGEESREYFWLLSRTPQLDGPLYEKLVARARELGFDTSRLVRVQQGR